jgi:hypothetical protein
MDLPGLAQPPEKQKACHRFSFGSRAAPCELLEFDLNMPAESHLSMIRDSSGARPIEFAPTPPQGGMILFSRVVAG